MATDPAQGFSLDADGRRADKLAELERRIARLETGSPVVQAGTGAPTSSPRDGTLYVDTATPRLYVRRAGAWGFTAV